MPGPDNNHRIERDSPPETFLPSYDQPTPETRTNTPREETAERDLNETTFSPRARSLIIVLFLVTISIVPAIQFASDLARKQTPSILGILGGLLPPASSLRSPVAFWNAMPHHEELKSAEKSLETESVVSNFLLPWVQLGLTSFLGMGSDQGCVGRDWWLFYRPDVEYVVGSAFLDPEQMVRRSHLGSQPDPVKAIVDFRDQLAARGIDLIIVPAPVKPAIDAGMLTGWPVPLVEYQNASYPEFVRRLQSNSVRLFDPAAVLMEAKVRAHGAPLYLATDTHWRPESMESVAAALARAIKLPGPPAPVNYSVLTNRVSNLGDIGNMLRFPAGWTVFPHEQATIHQVAIGNALWRPSTDADILLLGDSFSNIYSLEPMHWGEAAGFAEQLSRALGRPMDCILRNDNGAFATREFLSRELARGHDRLEGKKLVVWEFATRELAQGDWKLLPLRLGVPPAASFLVLNPGQHAVIAGTVEAVSSVPRPRSVPYEDHIMTVELGDISGAPASQAGCNSCVVCLFSMRGNVWTRAARLRPGDRVKVNVEPWDDVSATYDKFNHSDLDDPALQLQPPLWGSLAD